MTLNIATDSALDLSALRAIQLFLRQELDQWLAQRLVTSVTAQIVEGRFVDEEPDVEAND